MDDFFLLIFILSIPTLIVGLIKPALFKIQTRSSVLGIVGGVMISSFVLFGVTSTPKETEFVTAESNKIVEVSTTTIEATTPTKSVVTTVKTDSVIKPVVSISKTESQYIYYTVTEVVDGDTIKVDINGTTETLRLIGLDTPETVDPRKPVQCFGKESSNKAKELLTGKRVRIEEDLTQGKRDKYNRLLAYIYYGESDIFYNKYMIEAGYAHEYTYSTPYKYQTEFKEAQKLAQQNQLGLWSPNTCGGVTNQTETNIAPDATQSSGKHYTSSMGSKYYPESCTAWQNLSKSNLRTFNSLDELLATYPKRVLADVCK